MWAFLQNKETCVISQGNILIINFNNFDLDFYIFILSPVYPSVMAGFICLNNDAKAAILFKLMWTFITTRHYSNFEVGTVNIFWKQWVVNSEMVNDELLQRRKIKAHRWIQEPAKHLHRSEGALLSLFNHSINASPFEKLTSPFCKLFYFQLL